MWPGRPQCDISDMKKIMKSAVAMAVALCVMAAMASCGGGVNKEERLQKAAASLDSVLAESEAPVTAVKAVADGKDIRVDAVVRDSLIRFEAVGDALMKVALGCSVAEVTEEYAEVDGKLKLLKRKKTKKDIPPDLKAVQLILEKQGGGGGISALSDEELEKEKQRLLKLLNGNAEQ